MRWGVLVGILLLVGCASTPPRLSVTKGLWEADFNASCEWSTWDGGHQWGTFLAPSFLYCVNDRGLCVGLEGQAFWGHQKTTGVSLWSLGIAAVPTFTLLLQDVKVEGWQTIPFVGCGFGPCFYIENLNGNSESDVAMRMFLRGGFKVLVTHSVGVNLEARITYTSWSERFFRYGRNTCDFGFYAGFVVFFCPH